MTVCELPPTSVRRSGPSGQVTAKAHRLLTGGQVTVWTVTSSRITGYVTGASGVHHVVGTPHRWRCSCPSWRPCAHLTALQLVAPTWPQEGRP